MENAKKVDDLYNEYLDGKLDLVFEFQEVPKEKKIELNYPWCEAEILPFYEGVAPVVDKRGRVNFDCKARFIDDKGNFLFNKEFYFAYAFSDGVSRVVNDKHENNYINLSGQLISNNWYMQATDFHNSIAAVYDGNSWYFIDKCGARINDQEYEGVFYVGENLFAVLNKNKLTIIDASFKPINNDLYDKVGCFSDGVIVVGINNKLRVINKNGDYINDEEYDEREIPLRDCIFRDGIAFVKHRGKYKLIDKYGKSLNCELYDVVNGFYDGFVCVIVNGKYKFIGKDGKAINNELYDYASNFSCGRAIVAKAGRYNVINTKGETILEKWIPYFIHEFSEGVARVQKNGDKFGIIQDSYNFIDTHGDFIFNFFSDIPWVGYYSRIYENFTQICKKVVCRRYELDDYDFKKNSFGYTCGNSVDSFSIKYKPIKKYGVRFFLCLDKKNVYLFDRMTLEYKEIGTANAVSYDDNFIFGPGDVVTLVYENKLIDITEYYNKHKLQFENDCFKINSGVGDIYTWGEFLAFNATEVARIVEDSAKQNAMLRLRRINEQLLEEAEETSNAELLSKSAGEFDKKSKLIFARNIFSKVLRLLEEGGIVLSKEEKSHVDAVSQMLNTAIDDNTSADMQLIKK